MPYGVWVPVINSGETGCRLLYSICLIDFAYRRGRGERLLPDGGVQRQLSTTRRGGRDRPSALRPDVNQQVRDGQLRPPRLLRRRAPPAARQVLWTTSLPCPRPRRRPVLHAAVSKRLHILPRGHLPLPAR